MGLLLPNPMPKPSPLYEGRVMIPTENLQLRVAQLREKARAGTLSREEMQDGIRYLREQRLAAPNPSSYSTKPRTAKPLPTKVDADDLLKSFI